MKKLFIILIIFICSNAWTQDFGFGFGFGSEYDDEDDDLQPVSGSSVAVNAGGEVTVEATPFVYEFLERAEPEDISYWNVKFNFSITSYNADFISAFNFNADSIRELWTGSNDLFNANHTPLIIDEAFLRLYIGSVNIETGFRKLSWGKADSGGPLDVTNPIDYSDLRNITDIKAKKIARPMVHITLNTGSFSKLEGVFIPNFYGHRFASDGRWMPGQVKEMQDLAQMFFFFPDFPNTEGIEYFQAGVRYTTTIGSADIGCQYYYGNLFRPVIRILPSPQIKYNRYHQIGIDYAQVILSLNVRSEAAIHLTDDLSGNDGSVRNPFIGWSLGFDRDLFWGINLNIQCNETIRLFDNKVGNSPIFDAEAGTDVTSTRLSAQLSKKYFRDKLESKASVIWDIENADCYVIPAIIWSNDNLSVELSAGIFAGNVNGELGQYWNNSFIKLGLKYSF